MAISSLKVPVSKPKAAVNKDEKGKEEISIFEYEIPETLEEALEKYPYLKTYIESLETQPIYVNDPSLEIGSDKPNVIYPLSYGAFVHISVGDEMGKYNLIEPKKPDRKILDQVEDAIAKLVSEREVSIRDEREKERALVRLFREAIRRKMLKIPPDVQMDALYHFLREKVGHGVLDDFLADPWLEDVSVPGEGKVYVYHKFFGSLESNIELSKEDTNNLLRTLSERYGKVLSFTHPIIDVHLPDGSRFNIVFGEDISLKGSNFTIRKFPKEPISVAHLIRWSTFSPELGAYMWILLEVGVSCFICGETASGKTTTLNAFAGMIRPNAKIVSIEETPEVNLPHRNWVREVTRMHTGSMVTMFDLLKAALRQRPDQIIVGEIRGEEGRIAFQAIETGHPVMSTIHAGDLEQLFQRLTSDPINVPKAHISGLNLAVFQNRIKRGTKLVRRVTSVNEILGYDLEEGSLNYLPTFIYDADRDHLRFTGTSFMMETKVLPFRGWTKDRLPDLYDELRRRAEILKILADKNPRFRNVWRTVIEVENRGFDAVYWKIKEGKCDWLS
ncbi:MAG: type II/IV secretion system ATPase subunit [Nitrososphaerota archaeon]|nr:type II/IV secretion system ATPase subunit [Candidatus Bathyarchaeota archaeon]MDW8048373.1 type II/IV secretion system ATPase subunit [Nitrososphaerota archaeon]